jgi:prepilin-type N-terminal cleavage/methylation domain-containing protein
MDKNIQEGGLTLIEVIVVLVIIGILAAVSIPSFLGYIENAEVEVCNVNTLQLESMYTAHLTLGNIDHSDVTFTQYIQEYGQEICPTHGEITYEDGKVKCSIHQEDGGKDDDNGSVPIL